MAGKMGSFTSSIGTMRVTEQIDAEVMGVNSVNYLVFQKICTFTVSFVMELACFFRNLGGWMAGCMAGLPLANLLMELKELYPFHIAYAFIKTFIFPIISNHTFFSWILHERWCTRSR
jgi:phospholipid/cholesterol/gamma-HCH transport system permease protein